MAKAKFHLSMSPSSEEIDAHVRRFLEFVGTDKRDRELPEAARLLPFLIDAHRDAKNERKSGSDLVAEFYKRNQKIDSLDPNGRSRKLVDSLRNLLDHYYANLYIHGKSENMFITVPLGDIERYRPKASYRPTVGEKTSTAQEILSEPIESLLRQPCHHYHLTLGTDGSTEWHYAMLSFTGAGDDLGAQVTQIRAKKKALYQYKPFQRGRFFGFYIELLERSSEASFTAPPSTDIGWEFFENTHLALDLMHKEGLAGVKINETYKTPKIASSIAILCTEPVPGVEPKEGLSVVPAHQAHFLFRKWHELNNSDGKDGSRIVFPAQPSILPGVALEEAELLSFWRSYLGTPDGECSLFYGEPYFRRDSEQRLFVRMVGLEGPAKWVPKKGEKETEERRQNVEEVLRHLGVTDDSYDFLNAGEVRAMLRLKRWFARRGVQLNEECWFHDKKSTGSDWKFNEANVIILGVPEVNSLIGQYQKRFSDKKLQLPFRAHLDGIYKGAHRLNPEENAIGEQQPVYVLVSRLPGIWKDETTVTLIASDIGRAVQGAAKALTNAAILSKLSEKLEGCPQTWPKTFQLVISVSLDTETGYPLGHTDAYELVDSWPPMESFFSAG